MSFIDTCTEMLISAIKNGSVYKQYCIALEAVNKIPGLKEQVDDLRRMNYRVQNEYEDKNLYEVIDDLDIKMEELCKQLQGISTAIHQGINLDVPELS